MTNAAKDAKLNANGAKEPSSPVAPKNAGALERNENFPNRNNRNEGKERMSVENMLSALNLEMSAKAPRTEYSAHTH